ncbi:MAG: ABC transporter substrate-binding protein [Acidimicrobiia bacterium]|nr:ABC transporter substrate-binding protein [Acidimicrobiia bacterium]MDH3396476.1 ABC transporter substrate-binding protein [Acidimicrobiia bacterium]
MSNRPHPFGSALIVVVALALAATACTATGTSGTTGTNPTPSLSSTTSTVDALVVNTTTTTAPPAVKTDGVTVTDDTIYLGLLADVTGPFSGTVIDVLDAQIAFWSKTNAEGGIAGRRIELLIENTGYSPALHMEKYAALADKVVMIAHSTGSPHTLAILPDLVANHHLAVPVTWYSGWSDPTLGANVLETGSNYCMEAMNTISWLAADFEQRTGEKPDLAIATVPGDYGGDSAAGAMYAATELGLPVVWDGAGQVDPTDIHHVAEHIADSSADLTWLAADPLTLAGLVGTALQLGYTGQWSVSMPTFSDRLLGTALGDYIADNMYMSAMMAPLGADVQGMAEVLEVLKEKYPNRYPAAGMVEGYLEFSVTKRVLEYAAELGDMTPAGVVAAAQGIGSLSYEGLSPSNLFSGDANSTVTRATAIYKPNKEMFDAQGGLGASLGNGGISAMVKITDFFASDLAANYDFQGPCYVVGG